MDRLGAAAAAATCLLLLLLWLVVLLLARAAAAKVSSEGFVKPGRGAAREVPSGRCTQYRSGPVAHPPPAHVSYRRLTLVGPMPGQACNSCLLAPSSAATDPKRSPSVLTSVLLTPRTLVRASLRRET